MQALPAAHSECGVYRPLFAQGGGPAHLILVTYTATDPPLIAHFEIGWRHLDDAVRFAREVAAMAHISDVSLVLPGGLGCCEFAYKGQDLAP